MTTDVDFGLNAVATPEGPANYAAALAYFRARAMSGVETVGDDFYERVIRFPDGDPQIVRFDFDDPAHGRSVRVTTAQPVRRAFLRHLAERVFGLAHDVASAEATLRRDPLLAALIERQPGVRVPGTPDAFELTIRAVLGQQVSVARAAQLASIMSRSWGDAAAQPTSDLTHAFPSPAALVNADLTTLGLPATRQEAITVVSKRSLSGELALDGSWSSEHTTQALLAVPGIGPWTSAYVSLRALGDPDAIPIQDLGLRMAAGEAGSPLTPRQLAVRASAWQPWRGLAAVRLWTTLLSEPRTRSRYRPAGLA